MLKQTEKLTRNQAFVDGQNLFLGTSTGTNPWRVDLYKFREYLRRKYDVSKAYYFLGCVDTDHQDLYDLIQDAGFIIVFREHSESALSSKKGNVDTDIVFTMMRNFHESPEIEKFFLVSGDGDYYKMIRYLHGQGKLGKVLFPARNKASSLYRQLGRSYFDFLDFPDLRKKIEYKK